MFQLTQTAAMTLEQVRRQQQIPDGYGLRISGSQTPAGDIGLELAFTEAPSPTDRVTEHHGTRVFVAEEVAEPLADIALDTSPGPVGAESGAEDLPELVLRPQQPGMAS